MHEIAVAAAHELRASERRSARWVGADALRELEGEKVRARLGLPA
jgi:3-methyladenine DNA glycosylase AlkD